MSRRQLAPWQMRDWAAAAWLFAAVAVLFFLISPAAGDFHWSESPRNALNGAFVLDLLSDRPFGDPKAWAYDYYLQYPALTILFYPPLLHIELAAVFAVVGVSHTAALGLMAVHAGLLAAALYRISRRIADPAWSLAVVAVTVFSPEMLLWGRQILLEMPMLSFLVWSGWFWLRYLEQGKNTQLGLCVLLFLLAIYTKQTAAFAAPAFIVTALAVRGKTVLSDRALWISGLALSAAVIPLVAIQLVFAKFNIGSVIEHRDIDVPRWSWADISFYARTMIYGLGPVVAALAALGMWSSFAAARHGVPATRRTAHQFLLVWWLSAYLTLTLISMKYGRYGLLFYPPFVAAGFAGLAMMIGRWQTAAKVLCGMLIGLAAFNAVTLAPPYVSGYRQVAEYAVTHVAPGRRIAFSGNRDGAFIFNVRELDPERRQTIVRIDKLLLRINIVKELGVGEIYSDISPDKIADKLAENGVDILVVEPDFLTDVPSMIAFYRALASPKFELLERVRVSAEPSVGERELAVYRTRMTLPPDNAPLRYDIPTANMTLQHSAQSAPSAEIKTDTGGLH